MGCESADLQPFFVCFLLNWGGLLLRWLRDLGKASFDRLVQDNFLEAPALDSNVTQDSSPMTLAVSAGHRRLILQLFSYT